MTDYSLDIAKITSGKNSPAVTAKEVCGKTPLHHAFQNEHKSALQMVRLLEEKGAHIVGL